MSFTSSNRYAIDRFLSCWDNAQYPLLRNHSVAGSIADLYHEPSKTAVLFRDVEPGTAAKTDLKTPVILIPTVVAENLPEYAVTWVKLAIDKAMSQA